MLRPKNEEVAPRRAPRPPDRRADGRRAFPPVLDTAAACAFLGVSEPVLREAMRRQGLPYRRIGAKVLRFSPEALAAWVRGGLGTPGDEPLDDADAIA
jgi:hypothetical protein